MLRAEGKRLPDTENSDNDCLDVPRKLVDKGEDVHYEKKNADNASVDLKNSRETNPARLVWPGLNPSLILYQFPNRRRWGGDRASGGSTT